MQLFEQELEQAKTAIESAGRNKDDFTFEVSHLPPDPDDVAMFTQRYEIAIRNLKTDKSATALGGIGLRWVEDFDEALREGAFD